MSRRQRARATPATGNGRGIAVGIQMLRVGEAPPDCPAVADEPTPTPGACTLAISRNVTTLGSGSCCWLLILLGADDSEVVWAATWDGMDDDPYVVQFDSAMPEAGPAQIVCTTSGSVQNIVFYATQHGVTVQTEPTACLV